MLLVYSAKPHISRILMQHIKELILEDLQENEEIKFIHQLMFRNIHLNYSQTKNISWRELPCTIEPQYTISENMEHWLPMEFKDGSLQKTHITFQEVKLARKIIFITDFSSSDIHDLEIFLNHIKTTAQCHFLFPYTLDKKSLEHEFFKNTESLKDYKEIIKQSKIRRFFTYNYNINSIFIFGKILKNIGLNNNHTFISKYGLQAMYFIKKNQMSNSHLMYKMGKWQGTGKYKIDRVYLGSIISISAIIDTLKEHELIEEKDKVISLSTLGEKFISSLHKDCQDLDLPFRIHIWQNMDEETSKSKIQTYLKSFFGKQKRKENK